MIGLLLIACWQHIAYGQNVTYSPYQKFELHASDFSVVGKVADKLYTYRATPDGFFLDAYDESMQLQATVVLDFFPNKIYETRFITSANSIIVLYQSIEGNNIIQYAALLDNTGRLKKEPVKLDNAKAGIFGANGQYFSSAVSDNKNSILVYATEEHKETLEMTCIWIDAQLNVQKRSKATFKADNNVSHGEVILGNDGTVFVPLYTPVGSKELADQIWLLSLPLGSTKFIGKEMPLNNKFAGNTFMKMDYAKNRIYIGGFYADKKNGSYEGVLYANYDIASGIFENRKNIFFDEYLRNGTGERNKKKAFDDYKVKQIIVKNDGGFVLIAEEYFISTRNSGYSPGMGYYSMYAFGPMTRTIREYHYNDILALSYNGDGKRDWNSFIRKNQYSQEDGGLFSSYAIMNSGGTLGFLFNDFNVSHSRIQFAAMDGDGKLNINALSAGDIEDPDWLPRSAKQVAAKELVVPCLRKKQICFAKIVF